MLYYYKERQRLFQEQKVQNRLHFSECERLQNLLDANVECTMKAVGRIEDLDETYKEILVAFGMSLLLILPAGYFLARGSLQPMRQSIETIDSFVNGIVHDINTPLSIIKLNAQSMKPQLAKESRLLEQNSRILQAVSDVQSLEAQLLFSLKAEGYTLKCTRFDVYGYLQNRLAYWNDIRTSVTVELQGSPLVIEADRSIFSRMIDNIILNAVKFSARNTQVLIRLNKTTLMIEDHGIGIKNPKEIFAKYYREEKIYKGLGLGLFIVKSVADLHHIDLFVDSKPGVGTRFSVQLSNIVVT